MATGSSTSGSQPFIIACRYLRVGPGAAALAGSGPSLSYSSQILAGDLAGFFIASP
jgi:hypothetical protein